MSYTAEMIAVRDAANVAASLAAKSRPVTRYAPLSAGIVHFFGYGQSLCNGFAGLPPLSTTQPYDNLMIGGSTRARANNVGGGPNGGKVSTTWMPVPRRFQPMVATASFGSGETPGEGALNYLRRAYLEQRGLHADPACRFVLTNCGIGGKTIAELSKGAEPEIYNRVRDAGRVVRATAEKQGLTYQVGAMFFTQGEHDVMTNTTLANYRARLVQLQADFAADVVRDIGGSTLPVPWFCHQPASKFVGLGNDVMQATLGLATTPDSDIFLAGPVYQYPDNRIHLTSNSYRWHGNQIGKAATQVLLRRTNFAPCSVVRATFLNNSVLIDVNVPEPPLMVGDSYTRAVKTEYPHGGLAVWDAGGGYRSRRCRSWGGPRSGSIWSGSWEPRRCCRSG